MRRRAFILGTMALPLTCASAWAYLLPTKTVLKKAEEFLIRVRGSQVALVGQRRDPDRNLVDALGSRWIFTTPTRVDVNGAGGRSAQVRLAPHPMGLGVSPGNPGHVEGDDPNILPPPFMRLVLDSLFRLGQVTPLASALKVDLGAQRLALFERRVVQIIGSANAQDRRGGQIWIDQETFQVTRVMGRWADLPYDLRLAQWSGPITQGQFPHRLLLLTEGRWIRRLETDGMRLAAHR